MPPPPPATVLYRTDFEDDLGGFTNGGADATRIENRNFAASGRYSVRLRDDSGREGVAVATTAWGGFALSHALALRGLGGERACPPGEWNLATEETSAYGTRARGG